MVPTEKLINAKHSIAKTIANLEKTLPGFNLRTWGVFDFLSLAEKWQISTVSISKGYGFSLLHDGTYTLIYNKNLPQPLLSLVVAHEFSHILLGHTDVNCYTPSTLLQCETEAQVLAMLFWMPEAVLSLHETLSGEPLTYEGTRQLISLAYGPSDSFEIRLEALRRFTLHSTLKMILSDSHRKTVFQSLNFA